MKQNLLKTSLTGLLLFPVLMAAHAQPAQSDSARSIESPKWTRVEIVLAAGYFAGSVLDAAQTRYALHKGASELNPLFGTNPSAGRIYGIKIAFGALALYFAHRLPEDRKKMLLAMNLVQWSIVAWNGLQPGVGLRTPF